jgi:localization factor PodJL
MAEIALASPPTHVADPAASDLYQEAVKKLAGQEKGGVALLTKAANLGYAPAEFHLGKLYENGEAGLAKDPAAARRWTERAADGGEARAMHNLALFYFDGVGGPKDLMEAASWFHKAAVAGLVDSQYNLGRLYEQGYGVQRDPIAAYKWYLVAAKAGDKESKSAADTLRNGLAAQDAKDAERWAATFHPGVDDDSRVAAR